MMPLMQLLQKQMIMLQSLLTEFCQRNLISELQLISNKPTCSRLIRNKPFLENVND